MKPNSEHQKCGIYCIRNIVNNKVYIGKSKNIYQRIQQHIYDLNNNNKKCENDHLRNAWSKYGGDFFEYFVLEFLEENEKLVAERELYWMKIYNSLDNNKGYNLRSDSDSRMIVHKDTSDKISQRLKKEWAEGVRKEHGKKLAANWKDNKERKINQSKLFSKLKTKYLYRINNNLVDYAELVKLGYKSAVSEFHRKKSDIVYCKKMLIERVKIEDIVQPSEKSEI